MKLLSRLVLVITLTATTVAAQTKVTPPKNKYTPQQDVQIGREAAAEVRQQYPIITDDNIEGYLERLGDRLVEAAPRELNNPAFQYSFTPVNLKDINAFALAGRPDVRQPRHDRSGADAKAKSPASWRTSSRTCCCVTAPPTPPSSRAFRSARSPARSPAR